MAGEKQLGVVSWERSLGRAREKLSARKTSPNLVHFWRPLSSRRYIAQRTVSELKEQDMTALFDGIWRELGKAVLR